MSSSTVMRTVEYWLSLEAYAWDAKTCLEDARALHADYEAKKAEGPLSWEEAELNSTLWNILRKLDEKP